MSWNNTAPSVYLVVRGNVESHEVVSAHVSEADAVKHAKEVMFADRDRWGECSTPEEGELKAWERVGPGRHRGRLFGYFAIEAHELRGGSEWTASTAGGAR